MKDFNCRGDHYFNDEAGKAGKAYGEKGAPHMYVINNNGSLVYQGVIDKICSGQATDIVKKGNTNYVGEALEELMAGKKVSVKKNSSLRLRY